MNCLLITEPRLDFYLRAAQQRAEQAFRPVTKKNHQYALRLFVGFALSLGLDYANPSQPLIVAFIEHLARTQRTAAAVLSTVSTLKGVLLRSNIDVTNFSKTSVSLMLRSIKINKRTPSVQRPALGPANVRLVLIKFAEMEYSHELRAAIIIMFVTAFRQSNIAPPTARQFDSSRHLTRDDVRLGNDRVEICQRWSKTQQQVTIGRWLPIPRIPGSKMCPHAAISALLSASPTRYPRQPFFCFHDGNPMSSAYIARQFRLALMRSGLGSAGYTLHSLRRGGAQFLQKAGVQLPQLASHGGWKSNAIYRYVHRPHVNQAFQALQALD